MIRPLEPKDAVAMATCMNDKEVTRFMRIGGSSFSVQKCEDYIASSKQDPSNLHFAIVDENDNWVGTISLKNIDMIAREAEYAIITSSAVHGKGVALAATQDLLRVGFAELGLERIYLYVSVTNERANHFYLKAGFSLYKTEKASLQINGQTVDVNWYEIRCGSQSEREKKN